MDDECDDLIQKEIELAWNDPEVDIKELMTEVYIDNDKRKHILI